MKYLLIAVSILISVSLASANAIGHDFIAEAEEHAKRGDTKGAIEVLDKERDFRRAIETDPKFADGYLEYAKFMIKENRPNEAIPLLERARILYTGKATLEQLDSITKLISETRPQADKAIKSLNRSPVYQTAVQLLKQRKADEALEALNKEIKGEPDHSELYHLRGEIYWATRQFDKALLDAEKTIQYAKNITSKADGILLRAKVEFYLKRYADAERDYKESIELESRNHMSYPAYGQFLLDQKRIDESIKICERGRQIAAAYRPGEIFIVEIPLSKAYLEKARVEVELKQNEKAEANFKKALELNPASGEAHLEYGKLLFAKGDNEAASLHLEEAIKTPLGMMTPERWKEMEELLKKMKSPKEAKP